MNPCLGANGHPCPADIQVRSPRLRCPGCAQAQARAKRRLWLDAGAVPEPPRFCLGTQHGPCPKQIIVSRARQVRCGHCSPAWRLERARLYAIEYVKTHPRTNKMRDPKPAKAYKPVRLRPCLGTHTGACPHSAWVKSQRRRCKVCAPLWKKNSSLVRWRMYKQTLLGPGSFDPFERLSTVLPIMTLPKEPVDPGRWVCNRCGCSDRGSCKPTCWRIGPSLCSRCGTPAQHHVHDVAEKLGVLDQLFRGIFKVPAHLKLSVRGAEDIMEQRQQREELKRSHEWAKKKTKKK